MPDWKAIVRGRVAGLHLHGDREAEIVEKLAQDLEDRYSELRAAGVSEPEAERLAQEVLARTELLAHKFAPAAHLCGFRHDLRLTFRNMRTRPAFSLLVIGMALVAAGVAIGLVASLLAARLLDTLLFGVSPRDPLIYAAVILGVAGVSLAANFIPARRAAAVDPMRALRAE